MTSSLTTSSRIRLLIGIFVTLSCVYMLTFSAHMEAIDTRYLFNGVASLVHFGDWREDLTADDNIPNPVDVPPDSPIPLRNLIDDPLSVILATPLYWLADKLDGVGLVHTVWLFNVFITAAGACVLFMYALTLGYDERVGVVAALTFGITTIVWTYSKTFFQENLTLLITLSLALALERWRGSRYRSWRSLLAAIVLLICLPYSKWTSIIAVPVLLFIAVPSFIKRDSRIGRLMPALELILFTLVIITLILLAYTGLARYIPGIDWFNSRVWIIQIEPQYIQPAIQSYLFSIGASVWGTSPILLLALPGFWLLYRQRKTRYIWVALGVVTTYALGYAALRGIHWFSGLSFPPRFLVPTIPFLMICTLPVLQSLINPPVTLNSEKTENPQSSPILTNPHQSIWVYKMVGWAVWCSIGLYGVWIQLSALSLRWTVYPSLLPPDTGVAWGGGMNSVPYLRWVMLPRLWGQIPFDFIWIRTEQPLWLVMFAVLGAVSAVWLGWTVLKGSKSRLKTQLSAPHVGKRLVAYVAPLLLIVVLVICTYLGLRLVYDDPEYVSYNTALFEMLPLVEAETAYGDVVLVTAREHLQFLLNYGKSERWRGIGVSFLPGERYAPNGIPLVTASNLVHPTVADLIPLLPLNTPWLVEQLAGQHSRVWLWADFGPDMPWAVRPLERYLTRLYYPLRELRTSPAVRLIEYDTTPAPTEADAATDLVYGETIRLAGYALPRGTSYAAGETLPITLFWQADENITQDYTVALFLASDAGTVAQGVDGAPDSGFSRTTLWTAGVNVQDNRALRLPADVTAGEYQLWVVLYPSGSDGSQRLPVVGGEVHEGTIGVLPVTIEVR